MPQLSWKLGCPIKEISFSSVVFIHAHRYTLLVTVKNMALSEYMGFSFDPIQPSFVSLPFPEV